MKMQKYTLYYSSRITEAFNNLENETKGEFVRKAIHFYLDYHDQLDLIISKLEKLDAAIANGISVNQPMIENNGENEEDEDSIMDILNMGCDDDEEL